MDRASAACIHYTRVYYIVSTRSTSARLVLGYTTSVLTRRAEQDRRAYNSIHITAPFVPRVFEPPSAQHPLGICRGLNPRPPRRLHAYSDFTRARGDVRRAGRTSSSSSSSRPGLVSTGSIKSPFRGVENEPENSEPMRVGPAVDPWRKIGFTTVLKHPRKGA